MNENKDSINENFNEGENTNEEVSPVINERKSIFSSSNNETTGSLVDSNNEEEPVESFKKVSATQKKSEELKKGSNKGKKTAIIAGASIIGLAGITFGLNATGIISINDLIGKEDAKNEDGVVVLDSTDPEDTLPPDLRNYPTAEEYEWAKKESSLFPEKLAKWETAVGGVHAESDAEYRKKVQDAMFQKFSHLDYYSAASDLPSEEAGFTSDDSKVNNEDGTLNAMYTYWTKERFISETNDILSRLTNPIYGNWIQAQYTDVIVPDREYYIYKDRFSDIIYPSMLDAEQKSSSIPIYADWELNNYGMNDILLSNDIGFRWIGKIDRTETNFTYIDEKGQYDVTMRVFVKYSAWTKDRKTVTKDGIIDLKLVANADGTVPSSKKVVIESGSLTIL